MSLSREKCEASVAEGLQQFGIKQWITAPQLQESGDDCYVTIAADASSCVHGFSATTLRPRYAILMRRINNECSKLKIITDSETIEMERLITEQTQAERRHLRVTIDGQQIPYDAYAMARSVVDNLCTVEFMSDDFGVVELQNRDFWLRFDGARLELRLLKRADVSTEAPCGACYNMLSNMSRRAADTSVLSTHELEAVRNLTSGTELMLLRSLLAYNGFLEDETLVCQEKGSPIKLLWTSNNTELAATATTEMSAINEFVKTIDASNEEHTRTRPIAAIVVDVQTARICVSTRAIEHCIPPAHPTFLTPTPPVRGSAHQKKKSSAERIEFTCTTRMHETAQKLIDLAHRRQYLLTSTANATIDGTSDVGIELYNIESEIEQIERDNAANRISVRGNTIRHHIPDYCTHFAAEVMKPDELNENINQLLSIV